MENLSRTLPSNWHSRPAHSAPESETAPIGRWVDSKLACWTEGHRSRPGGLKLDHQAWLPADYHTLEIGEPKLGILVSPTHVFKSLGNGPLRFFCYGAPKSNLDKHLGIGHSQRQNPTWALAFPTTHLFQRPELQQERFQVHFSSVLLQGDGLHQRRSFHHRRWGCRGGLNFFLGSQGTWALHGKALAIGDRPQAPSCMAGMARLGVTKIHIPKKYIEIPEFLVSKCAFQWEICLAKSTVNRIYTLC